MIIGITGSIGSGKTSVAKIFGRHGFEVIDADKMAHNLLKKNFPAYKKIIQSFGNEFLDKNNNIIKKKLGDLVFVDVKKLKKLNSIMHPMIIANIKSTLKKIKNNKIIIDAPLLLETNAKNMVDKVIVIKTDVNKTIERNKKFSKEQIEKILNQQMPLNEKLKYADFVVDNNGDLRHAEKQVNKIIEELNLLL
ncbi:dephospho-CoA kinase [Candidatus Woesearchaeota archaeon]|nr:dephospho-CoA kinase [Candidatus Woesearchaeota archaeon]